MSHLNDTSRGVDIAISYGWRPTQVSGKNREKLGKNFGQCHFLRKCAYDKVILQLLIIIHAQIAFCIENFVHNATLQ